MARGVLKRWKTRLAYSDCLEERTLKSGHCLVAMALFVFAGCVVVGLSMCFHFYDAFIEEWPLLRQILELNSGSYELDKVCVAMVLHEADITGMLEVVDHPGVRTCTLAPDLPFVDWPGNIGDFIVRINTKLCGFFEDVSGCRGDWGGCAKRLC
jgi:hypothetical protein